MKTRLGSEKSNEEDQEFGTAYIRTMTMANLLLLMCKNMFVRPTKTWQ